DLAFIEYDESLIHYLSFASRPLLTASLQCLVPSSPPAAPGLLVVSHCAIHKLPPNETASPRSYCPSFHTPRSMIVGSTISLTRAPSRFHVSRLSPSNSTSSN